MNSKTTETKYGIVLKGKDGNSGLTKLDLAELLEKLSGDQVYPIEIEAKNFECSAMGFIDKWADSELDFDYQDSGLMVLFLPFPLTIHFFVQISFIL